MPLVENFRVLEFRSPHADQGAEVSLLDANLYPFANKLNRSETEAILDSLKTLYNRGMVDVTTQVTSDPESSTHQLDIILYQNKEEDEEQSLHFLTLPISNPQGRITGREVQRAASLVMVLSSDSEKPEGLAKAVLEKIGNEVTPINKEKRGTSNLALSPSHDRVELMSTDVITALDRALQQSIETGKGGAIERLREKLFDAMIDHSEEMASLATLLRVDEAVLRLGLQDRLPTDPEERFNKLVLLMSKVMEMREGIEKSQAIQAYYKTQQDFFDGIGKAANNWFKRMWASPEVKQALGPALDAVGARLLLEILPSDAAERLPAAHKALELVADADVRRLTVRAKAAEESQKARQRADAAKIIEDGKAKAEIRIENAGAQKAEADAEKHEALARREVANQTTNARIDAFWSFAERGGEKLGHLFDGALSRARALLDEAFGPDEGIVVGLVDMAGSAITRVIDWADQNLKRWETVTGPVGATGGVISGVYISAYLTEVGMIVEPWLQWTVVSLCALSGTSVGLSVPTLVDTIGKRVRELRGLPQIDHTRRPLVRPTTIRPTPTKYVRVRTEKPQGTDKKTSAEPTYHPLADLDDKGKMLSRIKRGFSGFEPPDEE